MDFCRALRKPCSEWALDPEAESPHLFPVTALITAADKLRKALRPLAFPDPVACTYNPLDYACGGNGVSQNILTFQFFIAEMVHAPPEED